MAQRILDRLNCAAFLRGLVRITRSCSCPDSPPQSDCGRCAGISNRNWGFTAGTARAGWQVRSGRHPHVHVICRYAGCAEGQRFSFWRSMTGIGWWQFHADRNKLQFRGCISPSSARRKLLSAHYYFSKRAISVPLAGTVGKPTKARTGFNSHYWQACWTAPPPACDYDGLDQPRYVSSAIKRSGRMKKKLYVLCYGYAPKSVW